MHWHPSHKQDYDEKVWLIKNQAGHVLPAGLAQQDGRGFATRSVQVWQDGGEADSEN